MYNNRQNNGFTLVELLVVIAIIALLMAILMPALNRAREHAKRIVCLANQKSIIIAWHTYTVDNDSKIVNGYSWRPYMQSEGGGGCWVEPTQDESGSFMGNSGKDVPLEYRLNGLKKGLLYPYLKMTKVFHCPADPRLKHGTSQGSSPAYLLYRTYSIADGAVANANLDNKNGYITAKLLINIKSPANKYILIEEAYDGRGCNFNDASWNLSISKREFWDPLGIFHNDSCTLAFADAHAESYKFRDPRTIEFFTDRRAYEKRYGGRPSESDNEDLQYFLQNWPGKLTY